MFETKKKTEDSTRLSSNIKLKHIGIFEVELNPIIHFYVRKDI